MSLTIDISLAQIALITAGTGSLLRRLADGEAPLAELAERVDRFVDARADTPEARLRAVDLVSAWRVFLASPRSRGFLLAHDERRGIARQDHAVRRMSQLEAALRDIDGAAQPPVRRA